MKFKITQDVVWRAFPFKLYVWVGPPWIGRWSLQKPYETLEEARTGAKHIALVAGTEIGLEEFEIKSKPCGGEVVAGKCVKCSATFKEE